MAFVAYGFAPSIVSVALVTIIMRIFEYGINKPTREVVFSYLKKMDRYKSSVMFDTFLVIHGLQTHVNLQF